MIYHITGLASLLGGFAGGLYAWPKIREERGNPSHVVPIFLVSIALMTFGWWVILPWSIGE